MQWVTELDPKSEKWPCEYPLAQSVKLRVSSVAESGGDTDTVWGFGGTQSGSNKLVARSELKPSEIQDLGDIMPKLLETKNKADTPLTFHVLIELGDGENPPDDEAVKSINTLLEDINSDFKFNK